MLKNLKIGKRLMAAFLIVILISSLSGVIGIALLTQSDADYSATLENYGFAQGELGNLGRHFQASRVLNLYIVSASDAASRSGYLKELADEDANIDTYMLQVKARLGSELGQKVYANLAAQMQEFRTQRDSVIKSTESSKDVSRNIALYRSRVADSSNAVRDTLNTMISDKSRIGLEKSNELTQSMQVLRVVMIVMIVVSFGIALLLAYIIARGISKPILQIEQAAVQMAGGSLNIDIEYESKDELGHLAEHMRILTGKTKTIIQDIQHVLHQLSIGNFLVNSGCLENYSEDYLPILTAMRGIRDNLNSTLQQINQASEQVASGSEQVSSGAQALSQGATEQASSVQELSATITEIGQKIKENAENAIAASQMAAEAGAGVQGSNQYMQELMAAMNNITNTSNEIGKIIKTIDDIAFQTNILALNAAVEAARAGAAGKGFAVVADEVRNLAGKSAEAAKNTTALIESTVGAIASGTKLADETASSLKIVVEKSGVVSDKIQQIAKASEEQSIAVAQITVGVDQISSVVQTNSATAEESAAASEELSGQAQMLQDLVVKFKLKNNDVADTLSFGGQTAVHDSKAAARTPVASASKY